jgi:hypothetical protein
MDFTKINSIVEPHSVDSDKIAEAEDQVAEQIKATNPESFEDLGTLYYYLIRVKIHKNSLLEDDQIKPCIKAMVSNFQKHEKQTLATLKDKSTPDVIKNVTKLQLKAFYKLVGSYYTKLEREFEHRGFSDRKIETYLHKMRHFEQSHKYHKNRIKRFLMSTWRITSDYGENFVRWGTVNIIAVIFFATLFYFADPTRQMLESNVTVSAWPFFNYFYYSIISFTTVGYGDISPITTVQQVIAICEALTGYTMLGIFLTLLQRKL